MSAPPAPGDVVTPDVEAILACPEWGLHAVPRECLERPGAIYDLLPANGGPIEGHGSLVALDCPHEHVVALKADEMQRRTQTA